MKATSATANVSTSIARHCQLLPKFFLLPSEDVDEGLRGSRNWGWQKSRWHGSASGKKNPLTDWHSPSIDYRVNSQPCRHCMRLWSDSSTASSLCWEKLTPICRLDNYQLRQPFIISRPQSVDAQWYVCWLDYCNSLLFGITDSLLRHLHCATAHLVTGVCHLDQSCQCCNSAVAALTWLTLTTNQAANWIQVGSFGIQVRAVEVGFKNLGFFKT